MKKTIKDILEKDSQGSGNLTPENRESYNYALGEPKYFTAYKATESNLREFAKEHIKYLRKQEKLHWEWVSRGVGDHPYFDVPKGFDIDNCHVLPYGYENIIHWIQKAFNLEVNEDDI
jgi:tRNA A37 N6-isopentenylltransferase MiaA